MGGQCLPPRCVLRGIQTQRFSGLSEQKHTVEPGFRWIRPCCDCPVWLEKPKRIAALAMPDRAGLVGLQRESSDRSVSTSSLITSSSQGTKA